MRSFDVVSELNEHELDNAVNQTKKEIAQRYDFKDTQSEIERSKEGIVLRSNSEGRIDAARDVLESKVVRRKLSLKILDAKKPEQAGGQMWRQLIQLKEGISKEKAKEIVKAVKDSKIKVQASIQGDTVRVSGKKRDHLQETIALLKERDFDLPLQFVNFRD